MGDDGDSARDELQIREIVRLLDSFATEFLLFVSTTGKLLAANHRVILGYEGDEEIGSHIAEHLHPDDLPKVFGLVERARSTAGFRERIVVRARHHDGGWRTLEAVVVDAALGDSAVGGAVIRARQIDEDLELLASHVGGAELPEATDRFVSLAEALPLGILTSDARGRIVYANEAAAHLLRLPAKSLMQAGWLDAVHPDDGDEVASTATDALATGMARAVTFRLVSADEQRQRWAHARFAPLGSQDESTGWIATLDDVTARQRATSELAHLATHDQLTGLPNRLLLDDRLTRAVARLRRHEGSVTVLFVDLDRFKAVNDRHGHATGDAVLVAVADALLACVREQDTVARLGGDEFVVLCESSMPDDAGEVQARIHDALGDGLTIDGVHHPIGVSIGSVVTDDAATSVDDLLAAADRSMYRAKHAAGGPKA
jgi:diguanylate cyclase (GGDEF)-like protein/PAS domain S-box-containing protein